MQIEICNFTLIFAIDIISAVLNHFFAIAIFHVNTQLIEVKRFRVPANPKVKYHTFLLKRQEIMYFMAMLLLSMFKIHEISVNV